jgi:23S rRNA pseudouridine1911/1915/1917 synthase
VIALDTAAYAGLREALAGREIAREYLALVHGADVPPSGTVDAPLGRDPRHPTRFRVAAGGRPARTHYRRLAAWEAGGFALLEVRLETGRTHQIRVHGASIGHPVGGDVFYGRRGDGLPRLCLHAARLRFDHPVTGAAVDVRSPLPEQMAEIVGGLGDPDTGAVPAA